MAAKQSYTATIAELDNENYLVEVKIMDRVTGRVSLEYTGSHPTIEDACLKAAYYLNHDARK